MSAPHSPLTYEGVLEMFRETREQFRETREQFQESGQRMKEIERMFQENALQMKESEQKLDRMFQETDRLIKENAQQMKETDQKLDRKFQESAEQIRKTSQEIGQLGSRVGNMVEDMVSGGNIIAQFRALGHHVIAHSRRKTFGERGTDASGQIDLFLEDGDVAIFVEVKTTLKNDDVLDHIERMGKYRSWMDTTGNDKKRYIGAVASPSVEDNVVRFAQRKGFYVIVQTGDIFEIIKPPEGFKPKTW